MKPYLEQLVYYATKAPSGHNTQPWKFRLMDNVIRICPDYARALPIADADQHELFISLGCALENLVIAARHFGYDCTVQYHTKEPIYIDVRLTETLPLMNDTLFRQIEVRQTTRNEYNGQPIPWVELEMLRAAAKQEMVRCIILPIEAAGEIVQLAKAACIRQYSDPSFMDEMMHWIRFNKQAATIHPDGIYSASAGHLNVPNWLGRVMVETFTNPTTEAEKCERLMQHSAALALFCGIKNDLGSWFNLGRSFERVALTATALGIHHAHENMVCEVPHLRHRLAEHLQLAPGEEPLLLIRLGYSEKMPYSYRRPVSKVVVQADMELEIC